MEGSGNQSEVARLRQQIAREHEMAEWAKKGVKVGAAKHAFITRRMEAMGRQQEALARLIGEEESVAYLYEIFQGDSPPQESHSR